jgi:alpha-ketoglutarate-dependent taurine dioxygenase
MNVTHCSITPATADSSSHARDMLERDGAVIIAHIGPDAEDARSLAFDLFTSDVLAVPPAARVFDGGEMDNKAPGVDHTTRLAAHTDGFGYGDFYPDYILLDCVSASATGGESFLIDGYAVLEALADDPVTAWVPEAMGRIAINQTEQGMQQSVSPMLQHTDGGRVMVRKTLEQRAAADSEDPLRDDRMVAIWHDAVETAVASAPRFKLSPGCALVIDNYRVLHGRDAYSDLNRLMWRVWVWTRASKAGPPDLPLHSDTRYAHASSA